VGTASFFVEAIRCRGCPSPSQVLDQPLEIIDSALLPFDDALQLADAAQKLRVDLNQLLVT
jgi:hypothetical protein